MNSRNTAREDFEHLIPAVKKGLINLAAYITCRIKSYDLVEVIETWQESTAGVIIDIGV